MSRTVITEDDLSPDRPPVTGEHAIAAPPPPPAPRAAGGNARLRGLLLPIGVGLALLAVGGAFVLGRSARPSEAEVAAEVRDAIREVRDGMRSERYAITQRALERQRIALRLSHRRELAALRKRYGIPDPATKAAPAKSSSGNSSNNGGSGAPAVRSPAPVTPAPKPPVSLPTPTPSAKPPDAPEPDANSGNDSNLPNGLK